MSREGEKNMLQKISTDKAPAAIGPYSQGIIANGMLYASGQIPIIPSTGELETGDITAQAKQAIENAGEILKAAGTDYEHVVKTTCFLADMADFAAFNSVYEKYFTGKCSRKAASEERALRSRSDRRPGRLSDEGEKCDSDRDAGSRQEYRGGGACQEARVFLY
jgi:2-iminobutanoate/2-iminopropanoate deaminase